MKARAKVSRARSPLFDQGASRTVLILALVGAVVGLTWHGSVSGGEAFGFLTACLGGVIHASGTRQGSEASTAPPPAE